MATLPFGPEMKIEHFIHDNGLKVLLLEDHLAPVVAMQTWFGVGSRHEKVGKTGIAHLFEHLMFGETEDVPHGDFSRRIERAGGDVNAATFLDWTYYKANIPKEALGLVMQLDAGRLSKLVLRDPQVASEKEVVANERRERCDNDAQMAIREELVRLAIPTNGYGHPTLGWMADIEAFTTEDCLAFYRTYYAPNNATLVLVGDVTPAAALALVDEHYSKLVPSVIPLEDVRPEPPQTREVRVRKEKPTPMPFVAMGYRGPALGDFDRVPLELLNIVLFGGRASRMHRALVQEAELAVDVSGWLVPFRDPFLHEMTIVVRQGRTIEEAQAAFDAVIDKVVNVGVTEAELTRAQATFELDILGELETTSGKAECIGQFFTLLGDPTALFLRLGAARRTTLGDILRVARRYLISTARTVVEVIPQNTEAS